VWRSPFLESHPISKFLIGSGSSVLTCPISSHHSPAAIQSDTKPEDEVNGTGDTSRVQEELGKSSEAPSSIAADPTLSKPSVSDPEPPATAKEVIAPSEGAAVPDPTPSAAGASIVQATSAPSDDTEMTDVTSSLPTTVPVVSDVSVDTKTEEADSRTDSLLHPAPAATQDIVTPAKPTESPKDVPIDDIKVAEEPQASIEQSTQGTDVAMSFTTQDVALHPASSSAMALDDSQPQASVSVTADTSMTDASQPTTKVAREREEDGGEEERTAKRARTGEPEGSDVVMQEPEPVTGDAAPWARDLSATGAAPTEAEAEQAALPVFTEDAAVASVERIPRPYVEGSLTDKDLDDKPISGHAGREMRKALAGVKKTKAGANYARSVRIRWPDLWASYTEKVKRPISISEIEENVKEGRYPTYGDFYEDIHLLYENAVTFNGPDHDITKSGKHLLQDTWSRLSKIPAAEPAKAPLSQPKQHPQRKQEPRVPAPAPVKEAQPPKSPVEEVVAAAGPVPLKAAGVPHIRRDSTKNKRQVKPTQPKDLGFESKGLKKLKTTPEWKFLHDVLQELQKGKHWDFNQWFLKPVDPVADGLPTYPSIIKKPMDLGTMHEKLQRGEYTSAKKFEEDFRLIIQNCKKFNGDGLVTNCAISLEKLFDKKWAEKDAYIAKHTAPAASTSASSPRGGKETDDEPEASEAEEEEDDAPVTSDNLKNLQARYQEESKRMNDMVAGGSDIGMLNLQETMVKMVMQQLLEEKKKLEEAKSSKAKAKASKPKKAPSAPTKKAAAATGGGGGGKKANAPAKKATKARVIGQAEKDVISAGINNLEGAQLERAIDIIKKDTHQEVGHHTLVVPVHVEIHRKLTLGAGE